MIQVIQRAFEILETVAKAQNPIPLGQLAAEIGIGSTTCANIVKDLLLRGYLEQDGHGTGYRIGPMALGLAQLSDSYFALRHVSEPVIQRLAEETGETALVSCLSGSRKLVVCYAEGQETIRFCLERGVFDDIHWTAGGPLLLAFTSEKNRKWICQELDSRWKENKEAKPWLDALPKAIERARETGYYVCETPKVVQFAAPVKSSGRVIAALGISVPQFRISDEIRKKITSALLDGAEEITADLIKMKP